MIARIGPAESLPPAAACRRSSSSVCVDLAEFADRRGQPVGQRRPELQRHVRIFVEHPRHQLAVDLQHFAGDDRRRRRRPPGLDEQRGLADQAARLAGQRAPCACRRGRSTARCRRRRPHSPTSPSAPSRNSTCPGDSSSRTALKASRRSCSVDSPAEQRNARQQRDIAVEAHAFSPSTARADPSGHQLVAADVGDQQLRLGRIPLDLLAQAGRCGFRAYGW